MKYLLHLFLPGLTLSAPHNKNPVIIKKNPTYITELKRASNCFCNKIPINPAGIVPTTKSHESFLNGVSSSPSLNFPLKISRNT